MWLNFVDKQIGLIDTAKTAQPMIAVRFFSTAANYASGDFVVQAGGIWVANTSVTAGAFNPTQWRELAYLTDIPAIYVLPIASTSVLGGVKVDGVTVRADASGVLTAAGLVTVSATPPSPVQNGALWYDLVGGQLYTWVDDGTSSQWVIAVNQNVSGGIYLPLTGGTLTGPLNGASATFSGSLVSNSVITSTLGALNSKASGSGNASVGLYNNASAVAGAMYWNAADGAVYLQQQASTGWIRIDNAGTVSSLYQIYAGTGYSTKAGSSGAKGANLFNLNWTSTQYQLWVDNINTGIITVSSDYRIKKDVVELPSMWETAKALRPISYTHKNYTAPVQMLKENGDAPDPIIAGDDKERWGFVAHELQETLIEDAATGVKDQADCIQSPNPWTVIATLTKALQEAMTRIEALEAGAH